jgi:hypothetical protein
MGVLVMMVAVMTIMVPTTKTMMIEIIQLKLSLSLIN